MTLRPDSTTALAWAARFWYLVAAVGMWLFVYYIVGFYYGPTLQGDFAAWNANEMLPHGHVEGDTFGNLMFAVHVLLAAVLTLGGTIQLIPQLRTHALALHRWNGRVFLATAVLASVAGMAMSLTRGTDKTGEPWPSAIDVNALLILGFAAATWTFARRGEIATHRRWALRTFMVVSAVWFLRLGVTAWILLGGVLMGEPKFVGEFYGLWKWGCFLVPLALLEVYLLVQVRGTAAGRYWVAATLFVFTLLMGAGVVGSWLFFWGPLL